MNASIVASYEESAAALGMACAVTRKPTTGRLILNEKVELFECEAHTGSMRSIACRVSVRAE